MRLEHLAAEAGVSVTAIRYYRKMRLLPAPKGRGRFADWDEDECLRRIRIIRRHIKDDPVRLVDLQEAPDKYFGKRRKETPISLLLEAMA